MRDPTLVRGVAFFVPLLATLVVAASRRRKPTDPELAAVIVATVWNAVTLFALNQLAMRLHWWTFDADGAMAAGFPVDLWLGWALLWGAIPALLPKLPMAGLAATLGLLDLAFMPLAAPVVRLGESWLTGELIGILAALVPAQLLAKWTRERRRLWLRVLAQAGLAIGLMFGLPLYLLEIDLMRLLPLAPALAPPAALGLAAVWEFARRGRGTPLPYDPPRELVTTGPYACTDNSSARPGRPGSYGPQPHAALDDADLPRPHDRSGRRTPARRGGIRVLLRRRAGELARGRQAGRGVRRPLARLPIRGPPLAAATPRKQAPQ